LFYCWSFCVTITRQQIFKGSFQVTEESVLPRVTVEPKDLGRWFSEKVTADSGKARCFVLCEKSMGESVAMIPQV